ncbi:MAG: hypothetical protein ACR2OG_12720 [Gemmatimonadaceae bacterium]
MADPVTLRLYADILLGNQSWPRGADTATMLYFLNLTRDKVYLPAFLKYAKSDTAARWSNGYSMAVDALAHIAHELPARQRLEALGRDTVKPEYRALVANSLAAVNSRATREILRSLSRVGLPPGLQKLVEMRVASPDSVPK